MWDTKTEHSSALLSSLICKKKISKGKRKEVSHKAKIRSLIRGVVERAEWIGQMTSEIESQQLGIQPSYMDFQGDIISFEDKILLLSRVNSRKPEALIRLAKKLMFLSPFEKYPQPAVQHLFKYASLKGFKAGRVLYRPGDEALGTFFLLRGSVKITDAEPTEPVIDYIQQIGGDGVREHLKEMKTFVLEKGNAIGWNELQYGERRHETAVVLRDILCIYFEKNYLWKSLKQVFENWFIMEQHLVQFKIFELMKYTDVREIVKIGKIKTYHTRKLINVSKKANFLIGGKVTLIQRLLIERYIDQGKPSQRLYHDQCAQNYEENVESVFMEIGVLNKGACFGFGERMARCIFWTNIPCKIIRIARDELFKFGPPGVWEQARAQLDYKFPTNAEIFQCYLYGRQWIKYKKEITLQCKRRGYPTTIHNVPLPLRFKHMKVKRSFMKKVDMYNMEDYLYGGLDPLEKEISHCCTLDKRGEWRERLFGKFKTSFRYEESDSDTNVGEAWEKHRRENQKERVLVDTFPSFFFFNANE